LTFVGTKPNAIPGTMEGGGVTKECWHFTWGFPQAKKQPPLGRPLSNF
jgi:hypothetical protein